jgi:hypothetical protein
MTDSLRNTIAKTSLLILLIVVFGYGIFRLYPFLAGPSITLETPKEGESIASSTFIVSGTVKRAKEITLQGRPISIDTEGNFKETLVTHAPYTILVVEAIDAYGKKDRKVVQITPLQTPTETR